MFQVHVGNIWPGPVALEFSRGVFISSGEIGRGKLLL